MSAALLLGWIAMLQLAGAAVLGLALIVDRCARRRSAAARRSVWALATMILLTLPLVRLALPASAVVKLPSSLALIILLAWAGGAALLMLRHARGLALTRSLIAAATPITAGPWRESLDAIEAQPGAELRWADAIPGPMLAGCLRPVILIPRELGSPPASDRHAVLSHELAHIARADNLMLQLAALARAIYWVTPLAWWSLRRLRCEIENAADDAVLEAGVPATSYAAQLVALARARLDRVGRVAAGQLRARVEAILDGSRRRARLAGADRARLAFARLLGAAVLLASLATACEARADDRASSALNTGW